MSLIGARGGGGRNGEERSQDECSKGGTKSNVGGGKGKKKSNPRDKII